MFVCGVFETLRTVVMPSLLLMKKVTTGTKVSSLPTRVISVPCRVVMKGRWYPFLSGSVWPDRLHWHAEWHSAHAAVPVVRTRQYQRSYLPGRFHKGIIEQRIVAEIHLMVKYVLMKGIKTKWLLVGNEMHLMAFICKGLAQLCGLLRHFQP